MKCLLLIALFISSNICAQEDTFQIYFFKNRYSEKDLKYIEKYHNFGYYNLFSQGYLESNKQKGHIDLEKVQNSLHMNYPQKDSDGLLVLDFEGLVYDNLRTYEPGEEKFDKAEAEFLQMLDLIKKDRPNLKIGIYGLPFKFYFKSQELYNRKNKFDKILKKVDFIAPSLYLLYSENQNKINENLEFLNDNLETSLSIANRLGKPVIPFFWYMVNPINKDYGGEIISSEALEIYLKTIKNYKYKSQKVKGVFWWDVSEKYFETYINKAKKGNRNNIDVKSKMDLFKYYKLENIIQ